MRLPLQNTVPTACPNSAPYTACPNGKTGNCSFSCAIPPAIPGSYECTLGGRVTKPMTRGNAVTLPDGVPFATMTSYFVNIGGVLSACLTTEFSTTPSYDIYNFGQGTTGGGTASLWMYIDRVDKGGGNSPPSGSIFNNNSPVLKCYSRCVDVSTWPTNSLVYFFVHAYPDAYNNATCALSPLGVSTTSGCGCEIAGGCDCSGAIGSWTMPIPLCPRKFTGENALHCQSIAKADAARVEGCAC